MALFQVYHHCVVDFVQVVVQQLNFIDRSLAPVSSHDQDSDFTIADSGKSYIQWNIVSTLVGFCFFHLIL